ncbi:MAG TPA: prephenate dehydratase [Baekduia sp.]|uniref:prephenate dehydratase n=1 Tax=Baekduia sp. TaxID=2600305 RepID=UPI002C0BA5AC|nr:prephenate dehydratase [Baekduia sp.]HMJ36048.1 prephenate dehydratase [Baekduia sp.]
MRLGYFGPAGTFTHAALLASPRFAEGSEAVPFATERDTILAAQSGAVDAALVPIENSLEGGVNATLDTLALDATGVRIVGEEVLPISHALIARPGVATADVTAVVSHPQPLGQCRRFLADALPGARPVAATSTAEAVRTVAESSEPWAAIGTEVAAALHGCSVLAEGIEDEHGNETRFVWVSAVGAPSPFADAIARAGAGAYKTSIVFHGAGDSSPGWLVRCLSELAFRGINLTRIESRPLKRRLGHYLFLADLEGREDDPEVRDAVVGLHAHCEVVRVLGSYRAAT